MMGNDMIEWVRTLQEEATERSRWKRLRSRGIERSVIL